MSELKSYKMVDEDYCDNALCVVPSDVYLKSEADKVIAELRKERDWLAKDRAQAYDDLEKRAQLNIKQEESNRHNKYKRCLAMADFCKSQHDYFNTIGNGFWLVRGDKVTRDEYRKKASGFWWKWRNRWFKIATEFKED